MIRAVVIFFMKTLLNRSIWILNLLRFNWQVIALCLLFVIGSTPDDQTERIIQQQEAIIANQEAEIAQLRKEDQALLDTLDSLSDSINLLTNEIELLRDEIKDADDPPDNPGQANPGEPQQDSSDTQD